MRYDRARSILESLIEGVDPIDGSTLPPVPVLQNADVLRALLAGVTALTEEGARVERRAQQPVNQSKPWTAEERETLYTEFHAGTPTAEIAAAHGRSVRAIEAQLEKAGLMTTEQRTVAHRFGPRPNPAD